MPFKQPVKQSVLLSSLAALALLPLASCANTPWASQLENSLAADPQLQARVEANQPTSPTAEAQLPANFPAEIPRYPNATLVAVSGAEANGATGATGATLGEDQPVRTRWQTSDSVEQVRQFYQTQFQTGGWQLSPASGAASPASPNAAGPEASPTPASPTPASPEASPAASPAAIPTDAAALQASRDGLQVAVAVQPVNGATELTIQYRFNNENNEAADSGTGDTTANAPQPGDSGFVGPVLPDQPLPPPTVNSTIGAAPFSDLNQAPAELQPFITDLAKLGVLPNQASFNPNAEISRRQYALWLVNANNRIYANQPARKIRLASGSEKPLFQDVPPSDPDFAAIQGLANAGLLPSSLTGDTDTTFRPDAPLTREEMILWKVPADLRQALPNASVDSIQQTWGFQDAARISPKALRAVAADYQNGDLSNIRRAFGYTTLFQPQKTVSRAEAAAALWQFGSQGNSLTAKDAAQIAPTPDAAAQQGG